MKNRKTWILLAVLLLAGAGTATWWSMHPSSVHETSVYTCPMHPEIRQDRPGTCPICNMDLVREEQSEGANAEGMAPGDGRPEFFGELAVIHLSPYKQQLIGLTRTVLEKRTLVRHVRSVGRLASGGFEAAAGDYAATGIVTDSSGRYLIADVLALDIPDVKAGQKAIVTPLSRPGRKWEGRVTRLFPYDGSQTRVRRVRVDVTGTFPSEPYFEVEILANLGRRLAIPGDAVLDSGTRRYVFVARPDGHFEPREVETGVVGDDGIEVLRGVKEGEEVVRGANFLVDADSRLAALRQKDRFTPKAPSPQEGQGEHDHD